MRYHRDSVHCPYCSKDEYYTVPGKGLGRCKCGGSRVWNEAYEPGTPDVLCRSCGVIAEKLTERVRAEYAAAEQARETIDRHIAEVHKVRVMADRLKDIERQAAYEQKHGRLSDADWKDHPLAVEYRALVKQWWALPPLDPEDAAESPTWNRMLTAAGSSKAIRTPGERYLDQAYAQRRKTVQMGEAR